MKYRVMVEGEKELDFDEEADAYIAIEEKHISLRRLRSKIPIISIHECGHDEGKPCINWEKL